MADMKFKAHQSFFIRKGWLSKGIRAVERNGAVFMPSNSKEAMDELGLGSNQVVALRYWLGAIGFMVKAGDNKSHELTPLCKLILERDPYIEEMGTLWAIHYNLACNKKEATSWYWFFNRLKAKTFTKSDLAAGIQKYAAQNNSDGREKTSKGKALSSIESDIDCILNTYISHERLGGKPVLPENVIDCPLGDLGILDVDNRQLRTYRKKPAVSSALPELLVLYAVIGMLSSKRGIDVPVWAEGNEVPLGELLLGEFSPGLLYNLDSVVLLGKLYELENDGFLRINRTAGSDVVRLTCPGLKQEECLSIYYDLIG